MPVPLAAKAGIIAVGVAVAAAIAVYESPELRRMADDLRRRIALALHSLGDGLEPPQREPRFNRPEDAEGFLVSRGAARGDQGVDADDETRRRQREELMFWNAKLEEKKELERRQSLRRSTTRGSSFDDFLKEDKTADRGTYVFNTGADVHGSEEGLVHRRTGSQGVRGLNASVYANPFADENGIDYDETQVMERSLMAPSRDEMMSDIYDAPPRPMPLAASVTSATLSPQPQVPVAVPVAAPEVLFDFSEQVQHENSETHTPSERSTTLERELAEDEYMTAGQDDRHDAYASIQAWAQGSNPGFYSPLPVSPAAPLSEPEVISDGALTPTDSASLAGSGEDVGNDAASSRAGEEGRYYDVMSDDDGMATPASWSEVGSVVSENEVGVHA